MSGLAFVDSLGRPTEFQDYGTIVETYGSGGPQELVGDPAKVTDDTQMALAVGEALLDASAFTPEALTPVLHDRFVTWPKSPDNTRSPGMTCLHACVALAGGVSWREATQVGSKGCGANMRVTPVGLVTGLSDDQFGGTAQLQAAFTHGHPTALAASELTAYVTRVCEAVWSRSIWCRCSRIGALSSARTIGASGSAICGGSPGCRHRGPLWPMGGTSAPRLWSGFGWRFESAVMRVIRAGPPVLGGWRRRRWPPRCTAA